MFSFLQYEFMQNAIIVWIIISIISPILGIFLIIRRYTFISDTLAHSSLTGIIISIFFRISPFITTLFYSVFTALIIEKLRSSKKLTWDMVLSLVLSTNLAIVAISMSLNSGFMLNISSYLFWSITLVSRNDLYILLPIAFIIGWFLFFMRKILIRTTYDEEWSIASWINTKKINLLLIILTSMIIALSLPIIWILLLWTLIILPIIVATQISWSFKSTLIIAEIVSIFSVLSWIIISYFFDISASWFTTLLLVGFFTIFSVYRKIKKN